MTGPGGESQESAFQEAHRSGVIQPCAIQSASLVKNSIKARIFRKLIQKSFIYLFSPLFIQILCVPALARPRI